MTQPPPGRRALVTGSLQGIGLAIAESLAAESCHIVLHGLGDDSQKNAAREAVLAAGALSVECFNHDLRQPEQIDALMKAALAAGPLDILVNNAGIQQTAPLADLSAEVWDRIIAINLSAAFHTMKAALPSMAARGYGRVVNIASVHGLVASVNKAPYVAAKFGLIGLSKVAALEYASAGNRELGGVTVNCICPGWTETAIIEPQIQARAARHGGDREAGVRELLQEKQPSLRTSKPAEIGQLAAWLCHPIAHNITGSAIPIEGGWTSQ
ncbi:MAG: 3-hydroxybutyrate dehydrogenase [Burkholderiales bacterium]|jgi:3-hydroxybutyrate dehydrogenase|nr:3-hydroxybutyrate dehydrogenase [Rhodocyclaceae bacterium]MCA3020386.1 3-hydroxybutyrate dehydrogenase [Rhodocyclaceae bacterium]MCA3021383.1 3-hydroxybutyrate dehydrogenase [Rhodocyclaceae bacterium]MCA3026597.1 3-hydroxybutyrate dehydrogenase [Rhodocyclaceae bacterium]MCA3032780.1 3-hydroxybutyrate dehydrogenase [Rhodocyclaceae bacterium]